ncbi:MAG: AMP-binding protein [Myxococcota bacterium]
MSTLTTIVTAYRNALPTFAREPAISLGSEVVLDHAALAERSARLAAALLAQGLEPGDRVALLLRNSVDFYPLLLAIWHAGLAAVPVIPALPPEELAWILRHAQVRLAIVEGELRGPLEAALSLDLPRPQMLDPTSLASLTSLERYAPAPLRSPPEGPDGLAWLFYTSGTTGRPKGVMLSHQNLEALARGYLEQVDTPGPGQSIIHLTPLTHGSGMAGLPHLLRGANQVLPTGPFDLDQTLALIERWPDSTLVLPPAVVNGLARRAAAEPQRVASLRTILYGSAPMFPRDAARALAVFGPKLVQLYGLGEAPMSVMLGRDEHELRVSTESDEPLPVGQPRAGIELRVVDEHGRACAEGEIGEVLLRGPSVTRGYWNDPQATARALRDGWLHTGDLGWRDEHGHLVLVGRARDVVRTCEGPVYPLAVERQLLGHPAVREVAIVGRPSAGQADGPHEHEEPHEEPIAFVCPEPGTSLDLDALRAHSQRLAEHARPVAFVVVDALPRNGSGKVLRRQLRSQARSSG